MTALLEATGLAAGYGGEALLDDVDLRVQRGERWFLLGRNGSGKTTLLRSLIGVLRPVRGRVERAAVVSYFPQVAELAAHVPLTVGELVALGLVGTRLPRAGITAALADAGLDGFAGRDFFGLSGGQRSRALLARAFVRRPDLVVLDEPTAQLDENGEAEFFERLDGRRESASIVATHRRAAAERWATHLLFLEEGRARLETRG